MSTGLDEAALKAARTALIARRGAAVRGSEEAAGEPALVCACGGERFGLPLAEVAQVLPGRAVTPIPGALPAVLGIVALSGAIVSVLGLARALGRGGEWQGAEGHLVVLRGGGVALAVDRVLGTALAPAEAARGESGFGAGPVSGYAPASAAGPGDFVLVDLARLLRRYRP